MDTKKVPELERTMQETNALLKDIEVQFGWEGRHDYAYRALRAVLHALRDRLTVEESAEFASQLPLLVRGIYYTEWRPEKAPETMDQIAFLERIEEEIGMLTVGDEIDVIDIVRGVLMALREYISKGELEDVTDMMPEDIKPLIQEVL